MNKFFSYIYGFAKTKAVPIIHAAANAVAIIVAQLIGFEAKFAAAVTVLFYAALHLANYHGAATTTPPPSPTPAPATTNPVVTPIGATGPTGSTGAIGPIGADGPAAVAGK